MGLFGFDRVTPKSNPGIVNPREREELDENDRAMRGGGSGAGGGEDPGGAIDGTQRYRGMDGKIYRKGSLTPEN